MDHACVRERGFAGAAGSASPNQRSEIRCRSHRDKKTAALAAVSLLLLLHCYSNFIYRNFTYSNFHFTYTHFTATSTAAVARNYRPQAMMPPEAGRATASSSPGDRRVFEFAERVLAAGLGLCQFRLHIGA